MRLSSSKPACSVFFAAGMLLAFRTIDAQTCRDASGRVIPCPAQAQPKVPPAAHTAQQPQTITGSGNGTGACVEYNRPGCPAGNQPAGAQIAPQQQPNTAAMMASVQSFSNCVSNSGNVEACRGYLPPEVGKFMDGAQSCVQQYPNNTDAAFACVQRLFPPDEVNAGGFRPGGAAMPQQGTRYPGANTFAPQNPPNSEGDRFQPILSGAANNVLDSQTTDNGGVAASLSQTLDHLATSGSNAADLGLPSATPATDLTLPALPAATSADDAPAAGAKAAGNTLSLPDVPSPDSTASNPACASPDRAQQIQDLTAKIQQLQSTAQDIDNTIAQSSVDAQQGVTDFQNSGWKIAGLTTISDLAGTACSAASAAPVIGAEAKLVCGLYGGALNIAKDNTNGGSGARTAGGSAQMFAAGDQFLSPTPPEQIGPAISGAGKTMLMIDDIQRNKSGDAVKDGLSAGSDYAKFFGANTASTVLKASSDGADAVAKAYNGDLVGAGAAMMKAFTDVAGDAEKDAMAAVSAASGAVSNLKQGIQMAAQTDTDAANLAQVTGSAITGMQASRQKVQGLLDSANAQLNSLMQCDVSIIRQ